MYYAKTFILVEDIVPGQKKKNSATEENVQKILS